MKKVAGLFLLLAMVCLLAPVTFAADAAPAVAGTNWVAVALGISFGLALAGCGMGQGKLMAAACEGIARNPGTKGSILITYFVGLAFIESLALYQFVLLLIQK